MRYREEIDGLRAVALLPVLFYHADIAPFSGGFVGVDVFFVISGYLITDRLTQDLTRGTFSLPSFYARRARRILPALFVVTALCSLAAVAVLWPPAIDAFFRSVLALLVAASNVFFWTESGYFAPQAHHELLLHTWSLSLEEQYYLLFPLALSLAWKLGKRRALALLTLVLLASFALACWGSQTMPSAAFYLLPTRVWELLLGGLASFLPRASDGVVASSLLGRRTREVACALGLLAIGASTGLLHEDRPFPGWYALPATLGATLVLAFAGPDTVSGRLLRLPPLVHIGLASYGTYLWHQPLFSLARQLTAHSHHAVVALVPCSLALGYASRRFVELPARRPDARDRRPCTRWLVGAGALLAVVASMGVITDGFEPLVRKYRFSADQRALYDLVQRHTTPMVLRTDGVCRFITSQLDEAFEQRFSACAKKHGRATIVLGDSHAMNIYNGLYGASYTPFLVGIARAGCRAHAPAPRCPYGPFARFLERQAHHVRSVLYNQSGAYFFERGRPPADSPFITSRSHELDTNAMTRVAAYLDVLAKHAEVIWLGPFVEARVEFARLTHVADARISAHALELFRTLEDGLEAQREGRPRSWHYLPLSRLLGIDEGFLLMGDCLTYRDADHFSGCGEDIVGARLVPHLPRSAAER